MRDGEELDAASLAALAKKTRESAGKNRAQAARDLGVSRPSIFYAEEHPERHLFQLRKRIIEFYSDFTVIGPTYVLKGKPTDRLGNGDGV